MSNLGPWQQHYQPLEALMKARHSCRAFTDRPVARDTIIRILELAQLTASWCNTQPWQVHIVGGTKLASFREALMQAAHEAPARPEERFPSEYPGIYGQRRRECASRLYESVGISKDDKAACARQARENFRMFGAPHLAVVSSPTAMGTCGAVDCGAYVSNFMLAAESFGVASIAQAAQAAYPDVVRRHLGLRDDRTVICGICFGYEDRGHPVNGFRTGRAPISEVVTWHVNSAEQHRNGIHRPVRRIINRSAIGETSFGS